MARQFRRFRNELGGLALFASAAVALLFGMGAIPMPFTPVVVANSTLLAQIPISAAYGGVVENLMGGTAPPAAYLPASGTCAYADGVQCMNDPSGNSWVLAPITALDARWFGFTSNPINLYAATGGADHSGANSCLFTASPCTLAGAATEAYKFDIAGGNIVINAAAGSYTNVALIFNGLPRGAGNAAPVASGFGAWGQSQIVLSGAGSTSTTLTGDSTDCYVLLSDAGAWLAIETLKLVATGSACQSGLYVQLGGRASIYGDVSFAGASVNDIHLEADAHVEHWPVTGHPDIITGNAVAFLENGSGKFIDNGGAWTVSGTPTFSTAFADIADGGIWLLDDSTIFNGALGGSSLGAQVHANSTIINHTGTALPTLLQGKVHLWNGGRVSPSDGATIAVTGFGTGATGVVNGDGYGGFAAATTTSSGVAATGQITITPLDLVINPLTGNTNVCPMILNAAWPNTSTVFIDNPGTSTLDIWNWNTHGSALANATTYAFGYACEGP